MKKLASVLLVATLTYCAKFEPGTAFWGHHKSMDCVGVAKREISGDKDRVTFSAEEYLSQKPRVSIPEDFGDGSGYTPVKPTAWIGD